MKFGLGIALATLLASGAQAETMAVSAARMVDVATGKVIDQPLVIVTDGKITAVGRQGQLAAPAGAKVVDLAGLTLLPGLIDMHVHLTSSPKYGGYQGLQFTDTFWVAVGARNAADTLHAGFTTVRNVGSADYGDVALKQAIDEGFLSGPRIVPAAYSFGATGGHCDETFLPPSLAAKNPYNADSPDEGRKSVRGLKKYGAEVIKICATGGVFDAGAAVGAQQLSYEEMKAIVDEAHMDGMKVAAHAHGPEGIHEAIRAGVDTIEHASLADDADIKLARERGAYFGMDIYNTDYTQAEGKKNGVRPEEMRKDAEIGEQQRQNYGKALRAGVKMIYSTDAGVYPHGDNARQFAIMVRYGATPLQAIQSATVTAAEALGSKGTEVGTISPGKWGDMVAVAGDPLSDVRVLEAPKVVLKGGEVVRDDR